MIIWEESLSLSLKLLFTFGLNWCQEDGNCVSATFIKPLRQVKSINKNEMRPTTKNEKNVLIFHKALRVMGAYLTSIALKF